MTIASAIDDVIIAQGGTPDRTDTIEESIRNLGQYIGGGGGSSALVVNAVWSSSGATLTLDKTFAEIETAYDNGHVVIKIPYIEGMSVSCSTTESVTVLSYADGSRASYGVSTMASAFEAAAKNDYPVEYFD